MALKVQGTTVIDDGRNIVNAVSFNGFTPADQDISISVGSGLSGGGDLSANRTISANIASQTEANQGTSDTVLMTPQKTASAIQQLGGSEAFSAF